MFKFVFPRADGCLAWQPGSLAFGMLFDLRYGARISRSFAVVAPICRRLAGRHFGSRLVHRFRQLDLPRFNLQPAS